MCSCRRERQRNSAQPVPRCILFKTTMFADLQSALHCFLENFHVFPYGNFLYGRSGGACPPALHIDPLSFAKAFARIRFILRTANARHGRAQFTDATAGSFRCIDHGFCLAAVRQAAATCALRAYKIRASALGNLSAFAAYVRSQENKVSIYSNR